MGEALMFRAGGGSGGDSGGSWELCTQIYEQNSTFTMPYNVKDGQVYVRIFGAGGGGIGKVEWNTTWYEDLICGAGGGGGYMNNGWVTLGAGVTVQVNIGKGAKSAAGGTSTFGTYLSAAGGSAGVSSAGKDNGGDGASGGGGNGWGSDVFGGRGYQFGGGGGRYPFNDGNNRGQGGPLGGNAATNGINTMATISEADVINADGIGHGRSGTSGTYPGGGGYGANGGNDLKTCGGSRHATGGGGGYGAAGQGGSNAGGGGSYGPGGHGPNSNGTRGGGGSGGGNTWGGNGICIIWYYKKKV